MCGIVGELHLAHPMPIDGGRLCAANDLLRHRGPDDSGFYAGVGIGLAMRRLSIIDVDHGQQPMSNERGTLHAVCNGEIYNHVALRQALQAMGKRFRTSADTEVLVHGYEAWGRDGLLKKLRGMFAFAIWDDEARTLLLARDRMGIKPMYFTSYRDRLCFASEIRSVLALSGLPRRTDRAALALYMRIGFVTSPHTMLQDIRKLPPAHYLWVEHGKLSVREYWRLSYEPTNHNSPAAIIDEFRARFQNTVDAHLMSEVPLGALLSGGIDSSATTAFMGRSLQDPVRTITVAFPGSGLDEAASAQATAQALGTRHRTIEFTGDTMADYPAVIRAQEEPFARPTHAALHHLFRACRAEGLKVVITGEGADELLGGYAWHAGSTIDRLLSAVHNRALSRAGGVARNALRRLRGVPVSAHLRFERDIRIGDREFGERLLAGDARDVQGGQAIVDGWSAWLTGNAGEPEFGQRLWLQSRTRMTDYINHGLDRQSMAHSVEARPPFLDHELWEFCAALPNDLKMRDGVAKYLLREASRGIVPEPARVRPKLPLRVPFEPWLARDRLPEWAECALTERRLKDVGLFDPATVLALRRGVQSGDRRHETLLSAVLNVQAWAELVL